LVFGQCIAFHGDAEVGCSIDGDDTPEEIDADRQTDEEGSHETEHPSECHIFKHDPYDLIIPESSI